MKREIIKNMVNELERLDLKYYHCYEKDYYIDDLYFYDIVYSFTEDQIAIMANFDQIVSHLWLDMNDKILKMQIWDLMRGIDSSILIEFKNIIVYEEHPEYDWPYNEQALRETDKGLLLFFSVINPRKAIIYNSFFKDKVSRDGTNINHYCHTIMDLMHIKRFLR